MIFRSCRSRSFCGGTDRARAEMEPFKKTSTWQIT